MDHIEYWKRCMEMIEKSMSYGADPTDIEEKLPEGDPGDPFEPRRIIIELYGTTYKCHEDAIDDLKEYLNEGLWQWREE